MILSVVIYLLHDNVQVGPSVGDVDLRV